MDIFDLATFPGNLRRGLAIMLAVVSPLAALFAWLNSPAAAATIGTVLFVAATAAAITAAAMGRLAPGLVLLAAGVVLFAGGIVVGY